MKWFISMLVICFGIISITTAQDCPPNQIGFRNQAQIDDFIIQYPNCTEIEFDILIEEESSGAIRNLMGFRNITRFNDGLSISNNDSLKNLVGLEQVQHMGNNFSINNCPSLENLMGLENLTIVAGWLVLSNLSSDQFTDLSGLEQLRVASRGLGLNFIPHLQSLRGLDRFEETWGDLSIFNNASLTTLEGLEQLHFLDNNINIANNPVLSDISALTFVREGYTYRWRMEEVNIYNNPSLATCNERFICEYLSDGEVARIENNAPGCRNILEVLEFCDGLSKIVYEVYVDSNLNGIRDNNELIYPNAGVLLEPSDRFYYPNVDEAGYLFLEEGDYVLTYDDSMLPNWQLTTDSAAYHFTLDSTSSCLSFSFGIAPTIEVGKMNAFADAPRARCNEWIKLSAYTRNTGTVSTSGTLWVDIDEKLDSVQFNISPDTTIARQLYGWHFDGLAPGFTFDQDIRLRVPGPPDVMLGDSLYFVVYSNFEHSSGTAQSNLFHYNTEIRCSFDPNDKLVNPQRADNLTLFEEDLYYTIRFQNTGNDTAYDVVVRDTLDPNLDLSTFQLLSSSHPEQLQVTLTEEGYLSFDFQDIFLPDSTTNLEGSNGYVSYLISPMDGLAENTEIRNTAAIYFDFNPPIITNTTQNIMVSELVSLHELEGNEQLKIFPNPTQDRLFIQSSSTSIGHFS